MARFTRRALCAALLLLVGASASPASAAARGPLLLVLNKAENSLSVIDGNTLKTLATVPTGVGPHEVIASEDGRLAFVANYGNQQPGTTLSVIDLETYKEVRRVDLGNLARPHGIAVSGGKVYFTSELAQSVARYDPAADKIDWRARTDQLGSHMLALGPKGAKVYTANIESHSVTEVDVKTGKVTQILVGTEPEGIDVTPDGREVWVGHRKGGEVWVVDAASRSVKAKLPAANVAIRVRITPDGKRALVSDPSTGQLIVFDAMTRKEVRRIPIGQAPVGILVTPDSARAFVAQAASTSVAVVDLNRLAVAGSVQAGKGPDGLAWVPAKGA